MKFTSKIGLMLLVAYASWLTGDKIEGMGYNRGLQTGYEAGLNEGYRQGRDSICMIKPI